MNKNFSAIVLVCLLILFTACERRDGKSKITDVTPTKLAEIRLNTYDKKSNDYAINNALSEIGVSSDMSADSGSYELWKCAKKTKCLINDKKYKCEVYANVVIWQNEEYYAVCDIVVDNGKENRTKSGINILRLFYETGNTSIKFNGGYYKMHRKTESVTMSISQELWKGKIEKNIVTDKLQLRYPKKEKDVEIIDQYYLDLEKDIEKIDLTNKYEIIKKCYLPLIEKTIITNNWDNASEIHKKDILRYYYLNVVQNKIFPKVPFGYTVDFGNDTYFPISEEKVETALSALFNIKADELRTIVERSCFVYYSPEDKSYFFKYKIEKDDDKKHDEKIFVKTDNGIVSVIAVNPEKKHTKDVLKISLQDGTFKYLSRRTERKLIVNCWPGEIKKVFYVNSSGRPTRKF
ncbi:MAG: hypothetical protein RR710_09250, partial [Oscillospiraceae bacterium]